MIRHLSLVLALLVVVCGFQVSKAEDEKKNLKEKSDLVEKREFDKNTPLDKEFIVAAHNGMNSSHSCLDLVEKRASSEKVKEFSRKMKEDMEKLNKELGNTIKDRKFAVVAGFDRSINEKITALGKLEKEDFDRAFVKHTIESHEKALKMIENQIANGKDEDVTRLAKQMQTVIRDHLKKAKEILADLK
ncbi:MAG: DUF4142 domain-containing protein [Gemmataceae bacterium]